MPAISVQAMSYVIDHSKHKGSYLLTLLMIANHAHADGTGAWPSIATLAKETRMSERGVQYCLEKLKESGELVVIPDGGPHGCNAYLIPMTQSLRQSKSGMTQSGQPLTQKTAPSDAIAIAPESKNHQLEPSPPSAEEFIPMSDEARRELLNRLEREGQERHAARWSTSD